jgi:hypothetical protein
MFGGGGGGEGAAAGMTQDPNAGGAGANPLMSILLGVGAPVLSQLMGRGEQKQIDKATKNTQTAGNLGTSIGEQLLKRATAGQLTDPQQAQVDTMKREQNARNAQYLSSLGIPVSSAMVQGQNQIDQNAVKLTNDLINQSFQQGIQALNLAGPANQQIIQNAMKQRTELSSTIGEVAGEIGKVLNTPGRQQQQQAPQMNPVEDIASGAQSWGAGEYDPYAEMVPADVSYT